MSNVISLITKDAAKDPNVVLEGAKDDYNSVLVIGWDKEDNLSIRSTLGLNASECLWLIEVFKHKLVAGDYDEDS